MGQQSMNWNILDSHPIVKFDFNHYYRLQLTMKKLKGFYKPEVTKACNSQHEITFSSFGKSCDDMQTQINWPFKLRVYFVILGATLKNKERIQNVESAKVVSKTFLNAFNSLSEKQKQSFLFTQIQFVKESYKKHNMGEQLEYSEESAIKSIETECQMKKYMAGVTYWVNVKFSFDGVLRSIKICLKKKEYTIDLKMYLIRKSKKQKSSLVLIKCCQNPNEEQKLSFFFNEQLFPKIYIELDRCIMYYRNQQLLDLARSKENNQISEIPNTKGLHDKTTMAFLDAKGLGNYLHRKKQVLDKIKKHQYDFKIVYSQGNSTILTGKKIRNAYKLEVSFNCPQQQLKRRFLTRISNGGYALLAEQQLLQEFSKKYEAVYQRYQIGVKMLEGILLKQEQFSNYDNHVFFMKGVHTPMNDAFVDFLVARIDEVKETSKLVVYGFFLAKLDFSADLAVPFLLQFGNMIIRHAQEKIDYKIKEETSIQNVGDLSFRIKQLQTVENYFTILEIDAPLEQLRAYQTDFMTKLKPPTSSRSKIELHQDRYLHHRYRMNPIEKGNKPVLSQIHPAYCDWDRKKSGGLVCVNQEKLNSQKGVVVKIISKVRKLIMSGKSPLEISLPVTVFSKESHLTTIAFSFSLAPRLLQPVVGQPALEKMKNTLTFLIGTALTGVSVTKPFNPILGETVQTWIDGCPMYLQQISHHPPIGCYLFYGRGYKLHGGIKLDIHLGMNSLTANSLFPHYLTFDNGDTIVMKHSVVQVQGGFIFGDRQLFLIEKTFAFDIKNRLFGEVRYGPRSTGYFSRSSDPLDYVHVEISKVTEQFANNFDINKPYPEKKDKVCELSKGEGAWTSIFHMDGKKVIDYQKDFPYEMVDEKFPLASNATYRLDLIAFIESDIEEAQEMKDQMEELQRYDKKLRERRAKK